MDEDRVLSVKSGYSDRAIEYYLEKVNAGEMKDPPVVVNCLARRTLLRATRKYRATI